MTTTAEICTAVRAQPRWMLPIDITDLVLYQHTGERIPKLAIRLLTRNEQDDAAAAAHAHVARLAARAEGGRDATKADEELLYEAKSIECVWRAFRNPDNPAEPAFISPEWIRDTYDTDQIATLVNLYNEARKQRYPDAWRIDLERVRALAMTCGTTAGTDFPEKILAPCSREYVTQLFVLLAQEYVELTTPKSPAEPGPVQLAARAAIAAAEAAKP